MIEFPRVFALALTASVLITPVVSITAGPASGIAWSSTQNFHEKELRGYGKISGRFAESADKTASLLLITCEDVEKAKLTHAKYLSDLQRLPGITRNAGTGKLVAWQIDGTGYVTAVRQDNKVFVATAREVSRLADVLRSGNVELNQVASEVEAEVPMWLDRWDRFGFRFYYRPWELPPGTNRFSDYDFSEEFKFAEKNDRAGFVLWSGFDANDISEGLTSAPWWDWALRDAASKNLPVGISASHSAGMSCSPGSQWFFNRYRNETTWKMPQFAGNVHRIGDPGLGGNGMISWSSTTARDVQLSLLQQIVRRAATYPNVTSFLEAQGELRHGAHEVFMEYGPTADEGIRRFLRTRYKDDLGSVNRAWGESWKSWGEIRVPELASFIGWGPQALDLTGTWRIQHEEYSGKSDYTKAQLNYQYLHQQIPTKGAPQEWFDEKFDDSSWPEVSAPGHDRTLLLPNRPAVYRRTFDVPSQWLAKAPRVWLYLWSLNQGTGERVQVYLNGKAVGQSRVAHATPHWGALELTKSLRAGKNQLSVRLPKGILAYRVYLSPSEPLQYPNLGVVGNTRWVDFTDWIGNERLDTARRGIEMIRQVDRNRPITLMAPGPYMDDIRKLAKTWGGNFHDTGMMGVIWADELPAVMRGARLPFSLEPGTPAYNIDTFKRQIGLYSTEGLQGIDYYIHIGSIMWNPEMRRHLEENLSIIKLLGKYHGTEAQVAALYSTRNTSLTGFPWGQNLNTNLAGGYWSWNVRANLAGMYESDALTESSFSDGDASRYRVIIDTNTSIMEEENLNEIEKYVKDGGTFVTFVQTGRHTAVTPNSWPISRLTGFRVTHIDPISPNGAPGTTRSLRPASGQTVFSGDWSQIRANGLTLRAEASDVRPLMLWEDGSVAIGMRKLGNGYIVQVGCKFTGAGIPDRIEPSGSQSRPTYDSRSGESRALTQLLDQVLAWRSVPRSAGSFIPENQNIVLRHFVSNNGLYNVWTLWNRSQQAPATGSIQLDGKVAASWAIDMVDGRKFALTNKNLIESNLEPMQTRVFITPRQEFLNSPQEWFALQRDWWRATAEPSSKPLPALEYRNSVDLTDDWAFRPLKDGEDGAKFSGKNVDDSRWEKSNLGIWTLPDRKDIRHAVLRKTFTVPNSWRKGDATFSLRSWIGDAFLDEGRIWLNGKLICDWSKTGLMDVVFPEFKPGSKHTLAVEVRGSGVLVGTRTGAWLWFWPEPASSQSLEGDWAFSKDSLHYGKPQPLPGRYDDVQSMRRTVRVPASKSGSNVMLHVEATGPVGGVLINGFWIHRFHHIIGERFEFNITPWVKFGEENEIELVSLNAGSTGPGRGEIRKVSLDFHDPKSYP